MTLICFTLTVKTGKVELMMMRQLLWKVSVEAKCSLARTALRRVVRLRTHRKRGPRTKTKTKRRKSKVLS